MSIPPGRLTLMELTTKIQTVFLYGMIHTAIVDEVDVANKVVWVTRTVEGVSRRYSCRSIFPVSTFNVGDDVFVSYVDGDPTKGVVLGRNFFVKEASYGASAIFVKP